MIITAIVGIVIVIVVVFAIKHFDILITLCTLQSGWITYWIPFSRWIQSICKAFCFSSFFLILLLLLLVSCVFHHFFPFFLWKNASQYDFTITKKNLNSFWREYEQFHLQLRQTEATRFMQKYKGIKLNVCMEIKYIYQQKRNIYGTANKVLLGIM